jgi:lysozyme
MPYAPSDRLIDLVKSAEKYEPEPYRCPAGKLTIGYGHVMRQGEVFEVPMSEPDAHALLMSDLQKFAAGVIKLVEHPLTWFQLDALVSFAFNAGIGNFSTSTLLKHVNAGRMAEAADEFKKWKWYTKPDGTKEVAGGLVTRRAHEADLFRGRGV